MIGNKAKTLLLYAYIAPFSFLDVQRVHNLLRHRLLRHSRRNEPSRMAPRSPRRPNLLYPSIRIQLHTLVQASNKILSSRHYPNNNTSIRTRHNEPTSWNTQHTNRENTPISNLKHDETHHRTPTNRTQNTIHKQKQTQKNKAHT